MGKHIILSLGSNRGDTQQNLSCALDCMRSSSLFQWIWQSEVSYSKDAFQRSPDHYANQIVYGEWNSTIESLLFAVKKWEQVCGRQTRPRWQAREIDIDILLVFSHLKQRNNPAFNVNELKILFNSSLNASLGHLCLPHPGISRTYLQELWKQWHLFINPSS